MKNIRRAFRPDLHGGWYGYAQDVSKGQFLELTDLMAQYGKDIPGVLGEDYIKGAQIGGKLYGAPTHKEFAQGFGFLLNKELADKYKFNTEGVKTLEEMEEMFKTIKENEPDVVPVVSNRFANTWGAANYDLDGKLPRDSKELKLVDDLTDPKRIEFLKRMRQWNQNGWFDKDVITSDDSDQAINMIKARKAFAIGQSLKPGKGRGNVRHDGRSSRTSRKRRCRIRRREKRTAPCWRFPVPPRIRLGR